ncbi:unnamed protein product [Larinioides sclopetarius]|uniref:SKICH domain-containing protein n=1 Tax=Larinioides sclopetarius TaxID=280406 RepID=A0AAV2AD27_9ARAC
MAASDKSVVVSSTTDFSSDSTVSDDWQELTKSDYAKVIFSDLLCNAASGTVECKFQITDNVHEDPSDYVGLFRIGYEDLSQCLVSKMLSQTKCEDDGKLQRCVFTSNELPCLSDGFYQFLYVTRDQEVCGASMPFQIKMSPPPSKESSVNSSASEAMDGGFLLVSNETERKVKEEPNEQREASVQQSTLSEQKKEEIAAWVSQNPDYYSLIEQIREHTFTIDALQQSKDLAMREVAELYEVLNRQNNELIQVKNMVAAYEEKIKMSQCFQDEKNAAMAEMRKSLSLYEEKVKLHDVLQKEKDGELSLWISKCRLQELTLKERLSFEDQQRTEIINLKKELEEMKEMQKAKKCNQVTAEAGTHSMDCLIQKAQDFVHIVSDAIKSLDYTNDNEVEKFYQLKIQLLIILRKMTKATDIANTCERRCLGNTNPSVVEGSSPVVCTLCSLANQDPVEASAANTSTPETQETDIPTSSVQTPSLPGSSEKEPANDDRAKEVVQRSSFNKAFESEVLEHQIIDLPRLDVINEDTAKTLQTDKPLDAEDITAINRLTERIIKRGFNLFEAIELLDDSASDSGSDVSEISECTSYMKKDMLCVSRVMDALSSYLSNQTSLDHLIVVEKEEDKSLIHRNKWDELLQKCALHYQIELLLEHIEKQKEGIKKVSEKICDLLTNCMLLKDEVGESKADCEKLQSVIDKKDSHISSLKRELDFKTTLLSHFHKKKGRVGRKSS